MGVMSAAAGGLYGRHSRPGRSPCVHREPRGAAAVAAMGHEERAEALEHYAENRLNELAAAQGRGAGAQAAEDWPFPTVAELEAQVETRTTRRGMGNIFGNGRGNVRRLEKMPKKPTILDFFRLRFEPANHVLQSATRAMKTGMTEEVDPRVPAARRGAEPDKGRSRLVGRAAVRAVHSREDDVRDPLSPDAALLSGRGGRIRVSRISTSASSATTTCRRRTSQATYKMLRNHKWYMEPRLVTVNDLYAFDPNAKVSHRAVHRHHRPPLQAAEGRPRQRQQPERAHVAHAREPGCAALRTCEFCRRRARLTIASASPPRFACHGGGSKPPIQGPRNHRRSASSARRTSRSRTARPAPTPSAATRQARRGVRDRQPGVQGDAGVQAGHFKKPGADRRRPARPTTRRFHWWMWERSRSSRAQFPSACRPARRRRASRSRTRRST